MRCSYCGRETNRPYWQRRFSNSVLCRDCWKLPEEDVAVCIQRMEFARLLMDARKVSRSAERELREKFKGTGIAINPRRKS